MYFQVAIFKLLELLAESAVMFPGPVTVQRVSGLQHPSASCLVLLACIGLGWRSRNELSDDSQQYCLLAGWLNSGHSDSLSNVAIYT